MTILRQTPDDYLFHLEAVSPGEAKRLWRERIKENWNHQCAYCGSTEDLTLDHVKPRSLGGPDTSMNVVCACQSCNHSKGHTEWLEWYESQYFFSYERAEAIKAWTNPAPEPKVSAYRRKNICYSKT